jgi:hypothetical protein
MLLDSAVTIPAGQSTSNSVFLGRIPKLVAIELPALTSNKVHIQVSTDNVVFDDIFDLTGTLYEIKSTSGWNYLPADISNAMPSFVRLRSASNEAQDRTIRLFLNRL